MRKELEGVAVLQQDRCNLMGSTTCETGFTLVSAHDLGRRKPGEHLRHNILAYEIQLQGLSCESAQRNVRHGPTHQPGISITILVRCSFVSRKVKCVGSEVLTECFTVPRAFDSAPTAFRRGFG